MHDDDVRRHVYDVTMREGAPPSKARLDALLGGDTSDSLQRLAAARMLVLQRDSVEILMAGPFSSVPTPFRVTTPRFDCYGNCIWDALGIAATLQCDATIDTSCADCGAAAQLRVANGAVEGGGFMHFALPPKLWWQDVVFT